jgi:hypothetical protein
MAFLFLAGGGMGGKALAADTAPRAMVAWSEQDEGGVYRLRFSWHDGMDWTRPFYLGSGDNEEILPAVAADAHGGIWVAWTQLRGVFGTIHSRVFHDGVWSAPAALETHTISDLAPSLAVDDSGGAWLAYSGSDGRQDRVYVVRWLGAGWGEPASVTSGYQGPQTRPRIAVDGNGLPLLCWRGFDGTGYRVFRSRLTSGGWTTAKIAHPADQEFSWCESSPPMTRPAFDGLPGRDLPPFVLDQSQAAVWP